MGKQPATTKKIALMGKENFCPLCGKTNGRFVGAICLECYLKQHEVAKFPEKITFEQCKECAKIKLQGKMVPKNPEALKAIAAKNLIVKELSDSTTDIKVFDTKDGEKEVVAIVKGVLGDNAVIVEKRATLVPILVRCDACMRLSSDYFEAIIQLRMKTKNEKMLEKILHRLHELVNSQRKKNSLAAVTAVIKEPNGADALVGSKKAAFFAVEQLQREFGGETKISSKLVGIDKTGKEKKRFTLLLRI